MTMARPAFQIPFGVQLPPQQTGWDDLAQTWAAAEALGFDSVWLFDHLLPIFSDPAGPCFEGWSSLAALAATTRRIRVGCMVTANTFRTPALLAKMAVTVDHITGGRLNFGVGAGWFESEHQAYGLEFFSARERIERLEEAVSVIRALWTRSRTTFEGRFYRIVDAPFEPKPVQRPHPPVWIGGRGPKWTLPVVARVAEAWNATPFHPPDELRELNGVLDDACRSAGRDPQDVLRSLLVPFHVTQSAAEASIAVAGFAKMMGMPVERARRILLCGDASRIRDQIAEYREAGVEYFVLMCAAPFDMIQLRLFAERVINGG
jgi:F420-dependent oxidoreductase-like protein